ncbi:hypothetical protein I552_5045 [Mycobacterium xenopi 3993]|nr:hypothetical protein I552_5045 [Mycobacterium xenopi 3993]
MAQLYQRKSDGQRPTANYAVNSSHHGPRAGQLDSAGHLSESSATRSAPQAHRQPVAYPRLVGVPRPWGGSRISVQRLGHGPFRRLVASPAHQPRARRTGKGVLPNAAGSPLAGGRPPSNRAVATSCARLAAITGGARSMRKRFRTPGSRFGTTSGLAGLGSGDTHPGRIRRRGSGHRRRRGPLPWPLIRLTISDL